MKKLSFLLGFIAIIGLSGCSNTITTGDLKKGSQIYATYQLNDQSQISATNVKNPKRAENSFKKIQNHFRLALTEELNRYGYKIGNNGIKINYSIDEYLHGNRFVRWWFGLTNIMFRSYGTGIGRSVITTNIEHRKVSLGELNTSSELYAGIFGGSSFNTLENAAESIAREIHQSGVLKSSK